jgi:hypothetical protein
MLMNQILRVIETCIYCLICFLVGSFVLFCLFGLLFCSPYIYLFSVMIMFVVLEIIGACYRFIRDLQPPPVYKYRD